MRALLVLLAALTVGCTGEIWYVDSRFTAAEEAQIQAAADAWTALGYPIDLAFHSRVDLTDTGRRVIVRAGVRAAENYDGFVQGKAGLYDPGTGYARIILVPERCGEFLRSVTAHEFGHSLGLRHSTSRGAVMHTPPLVDGPTAEDAAALGAQ